MAATETEQAGRSRKVVKGLGRLRTGESVSFAELVLAHFLRQRELYLAARRGIPADELELVGPAEQAYRERLAAFEAEHGKIQRAYWCTYEISAVALTEQDVPLPWWRWPIRHEQRIRLHAETDWATRNCPELTNQLHKIDNLAVRADEVLRGTGERIAMQLLLAAASHVLSYVDCENGPPTGANKVAKIVDRSDRELAHIRRHYHRAASNASRIVYAGGMIRGTAYLGIATALVGLVLWLAGTFDEHSETIWTLFACLAAGGLGAGLSVLLRMARSGFDQDYEVGRKATRKLAMARPFVGAAFAVAIFLLLKSGLVDLGQDDTVYFYAAIGFLAGFSERWARVIVGGALGGTAAPPSPPAPDTDGEAELDDTEPEPGTQLERTTTRETVRTTP
jgi:hypothetical protein